MKKELKFHYSDPAWPTRTLCGKEIDGQTGSPLNSDGAVASARVDTDEATCKTCIAASSKLTGNK